MSIFSRFFAQDPDDPARIDFVVGDDVVCIDTETQPGEPPPWLEKGRIYEVSGFCTGEHDDGETIGVFLKELCPFPKSLRWCNCFDAACFRPVRKTDISALRRLVEPVDGERRKERV